MNLSNLCGFWCSIIFSSRQADEMTGDKEALNCDVTVFMHGYFQHVIYADSYTINVTMWHITYDLRLRVQNKTLFIKQHHSKSTEKTLHFLWSLTHILSPLFKNLVFFSHWPWLFSSLNNRKTYLDVAKLLCLLDIRGNHW